MLFSVIVPVYNAGKALHNCIQSVKRQTERDFELIVIDDASTDGCVQRLSDELSAMGAICIRTSNGGVSSARNHGIEKANGEYIVFLDADDSLPADALANYKRAISKENRPDIIMAGFYRCYPKRESVFKLPKVTEDLLLCQGGIKQFNPYMSRFAGCVWGKCYKRSTIGNHRFDTELSLCEDAEFNFRVFLNAQKFVYINALTYRYTYSLSSTIRRYNPEYVRKYVQVIEKIGMIAKDTDHFEDYLEFGCNVFNVICFHVVFTRKNYEPTRVKCGQIRLIRENTVFCGIIDAICPKRLPLKHRITILLARKKLYFAIYCMSIVNGIINRFVY